MRVFRQGQLVAISQAVEESLTTLHSRLPERMRAAASPKDVLVLRHWKKIVGEFIARNTRIRRIRNRVLYVDASSAACAAAFSDQREAIVQHINEHFGDQVALDVRFSSRGVDAEPRKRKKREEALPPRSEVLDNEELAPEAEMALHGLGTALPEGEAKELALEITRRALRVEQWRAGQGWKPCRRCGTLFKGAGKHCPICLGEKAHWSLPPKQK